MPRDKTLAARQSAFQAIRVTEDETGLRTLRFGPEGASQSVFKPGDPRHLELPYARILPACLAFTPDPRRLLIVGLGGGTLPMFFHSHFPALRIEVVELDADVVALAKEYCGFVEDSRMRVAVEDGRDFIEASSGGFDVIILDSFDAETIPTHLTTAEFLRAVRKAVTPTGVVVGNIWGRTANPIYARMLATYRAVFEDVYIFDVPGPGTKLFAALPRRVEMSRAELLPKLAEISGRAGFSHDLSAALSGFRNARDENVRAAEILRD